MKLVADIAATAERGDKQISIPKGDYRFDIPNGPRKVQFLLRGLHDATLDFHGSTLWFETENIGLALFHCRHVTVRNAFLDWDPLPYMQGTVTGLDTEGKALAVKLERGYDRVLPGMAQGSSNWSWRGVVFDPATRELKADVTGFVVNFDWSKRNADGSYIVPYGGFYGIPLAQSGISVGDDIVILRRMSHAVVVENSDGCVLDNVTLYSSPFIGFAAANGGGDEFRRCGIVKRPGTDRLLAGNADGFNCGTMDKGPLIDGCKIDTIGDDFVNIHGFFARVLTQESPTQVVASRLNFHGDFATPAMVEFFDRPTMRSLGKRMATGVIVQQWAIDKPNTLADLDYKWHSGDAAGLAYGATVIAHRLTLDAPITLTGDVIVDCEAQSSAGAVIRDCDFHGSLARGMRLQSPHVAVERNRVSRTCGLGMSLTSQAIFWGEGPYVYDAVVRGNTFSETCIGKGHAGDIRATLLIEQEGSASDQRLQHDIAITNNVFDRCAGQAIVASHVERFKVKDNSVTGYAAAEPYPHADGSKPATVSAIAIADCPAATITGNKVTGPGPFASSDPASVTEH
jgi:hypothetical protein